MKQKTFSADSIVGLSTLLIAAGFIARSLQFEGASKDGVPGAGYFPIAVSLVLAIFSIGLIIQGIRKPVSYFKIEAEKKQNLKQMILVYLALIGFFVLWNFVPFIVAAILFEVALARILRCSWRFTIIYSIVVVVVLYSIFHTAFRVKLNIF